MEGGPHVAFGSGLWEESRSMLSKPRSSGERQANETHQELHTTRREGGGNGSTGSRQGRWAESGQVLLWLAAHLAAGPGSGVEKPPSGKCGLFPGELTHFTECVS